MDKEALSLFKSLLAEKLKAVKSPDVLTKPKKNGIVVSSRDSKAPEAELSLVFLARTDAVYLTCHVFDGRLFRAIQSLDLPPKASNILAQGVFFLSSLSEKNKEFSPDRGGARLLYDQMPMESVCDDIAGKLNQSYLPLVAGILTLSDALPESVERYSEYFSYPLTILALLERAGRTKRFSEILASKELIAKYPKEKGLDFNRILGNVAL